MRDIGKNIKDLRARKKMTQDELAEKLFVTRQTVSNYETGKSRPDIDMLVNIAEVLEADVHEVLYGPATQPDRKDDYVRFAFAAGISLVLWISMFLVDDITWDLSAHTFHIAPRMIQYLLLCPLAFFCTGYTSMQLLSLFTGLRPLKRNYVVWVRWGILAVLILGFLLLLPFLYSQVDNSIHYMIFKAQNPEGGTFLYESPFKTTVLTRFLMQLLLKQPWILGLFGGALWLFQKPKTK